ncbi:hypothetical protein HYY73_01575, partial [Candidatus Woesearchaeota archaeon]|nr:hypothetical protein [Candidatus Woesearchaeota archaeon]
MRRRKANKRRSRAAHQAIRHFGRAVAKAAPAVAMLILLFAALAVFERLGPGITGFAVAEKTFTTDIGKEITANTEIPVTLEAAPESLSISGKLEGQGTAKAYLVLNGQKYLILDTAQLQKKETESLLTITGRIVEEVQEQTQAITAAAVDTLTTETDNATAINETAAANETRQPAEDNTTTPEPQPSKTITAQLQYNTGTAFDSNNDGIETVKGAIDFTAAATQFSWQAVDEGKLCTRWKADSKETATTTVICNGNSSCCQLVELSPAAESWKEPFQVFYGAYNNAVGYTNNVSAQVIYADYSLETAEAEVDVAYSDWQTLPAMFLPITEFKAACAETCNLPKLLNGSLNATIIVELENAEAATTLTLNTITYTAAVAVNTPPTAAAIPAITVKKNSVATLNLSQYFTDNDGDKLTFAAASDSESIIISVTRGEIAVIEPRRGFVGTATATFTASDGKAETGSTAKITVADANSPPQLLKEIENVTISKGKAATLSLNDYFTDADNDNLSYDYYKADNVTISIDNPAAIATITPDKGFTGKAFTYISAADKENRTAVSNVFTITVTEAAEKEETEEVLGRIEINKPVKWRKTIRLAEESNTTTIIPAEAANITVKENSISIEDKVKVKEAGKAEKKLKDHIKEKAKEKAAVADENITIIIEQNATEVEVDYETPAPTATEQEIDSSRKQIVVASDFHYENVTAYTTLTIEAPASAVKLYWLKKVKKQTTQPGAGVSLAAAAKPTEAASEAAVEQLRRAISSRTPEKLLKSQETSEVYAKSPDAIPANSGSFSKSPVDNTLTLTCFFNAASFDHNGNFSFNDNATKSTSFPSGEILNASGSNDEYSSAGMNVTAIARSDLSFLKSSSDIPVFLRMSDKCALISSKANSGEYSNSSCLISSFLATDFSQKNVYRIFVSTTNCSTYASDSPGLIYISPFLFNSSSLPALDARCSFTAQSVMPLSSSNAFLNSSSLTNLPTFSSMDFLTNPDQFISSNCSIASFTSLGKDTVKDTIPTTSVNLEPQNTVKIFKFCGENTKSCENRGLRLEESPAPFASLAPSAEEGYETVKVLVEDVTKIDSDGNGLIDRLEWIVPSLSNETYEVEITILNVQSYPTVGGNWTVAFNTTSTANLTITAVNGTTYTEIPDNASTTNDLEFLELKCGANVTAPTLITNSSGNLASVFAENWSCDSQTAYHTVKVLTPGVHHQEFNFSSLTAYAHNTATNAICDTGDDQGTCTINSSKQLTNASILNFTNMVIDQNGTLNTGAVNFSTLNGTNLTLSIGGKLTGNFNITVVNLTIDANSLINATGRGYAGVTTGANGTGPGGGDSCGGSVTTCSGAGGGYGGTGGEGTSAPANNGGRGYGSVTEPTDMGSAGGGTYSTSVAGGNGGGAVFINVTDTLSIQGNITANGTDGNINGGGASNYASGGGSGGSIYVRATTLTGTGSITANGGRGGDDSNDGGGGGGGRIALYYTTSTHSGPIQAAGSRAGNTAARAGGAGTIYVKPSSQNADLIIDNNNTGTGTTNFSGLTLNNLTISGLANATLHSDTHLYATNISLNRGQLTTGAGANITATTIAITSGILNHGGANATATNIELTSGTLNHSGTRTLVPYINQLSGTTEAIGQLNATNITIAGTLTTRANLTALNITATNLTITVNGIIDITGKGNLGTAQFAANGTGLGGGDGCGGDSTCESAGAGYGGRGGDGESGPTNNGGRGYGSVTEPTDMGSAGGNTGTTIVAGGSGGGAVFINVTDTLSIQGNITANGTDGNINGGSDGSYGAGGGSGGSIYVRATTLTGTGTIRANGGRPGDDSSSDGGGGGGGRIALYYTTSTYGGPIQAAGLGSANAAREGGAGTIYIKPSSQNADLIIDNNNIGTSGTTNFSGLTLNNLTISGRANATLSPNTLIDAVNISLNNGVLSTDTGANITATTITMTSGTLNHSGTRLHAQYINQLSGTTEAIGQLNATNITIAGTLTTRANLTALNITATNLTVIGSGTIDITGKGNLGTAQYTANGTGPGGGDGCGGDTTCSSAGAGYGGRGGDGLTGPTNNGGQSYGSVTEPTDIGSAGGNTATTIVAGGNGGGAVFINVTDTLSIQGNITANGTDGKIDGGGSTNDGAGGGSGGSIYVRATTLTGTGNITANGGRGGDDSVDGGGGAGGRIALYYTTNEYTGTITAQGNTGGSNANAGGAGTIYYKPAAANPKILIDNGNVARGVTTSGIPITPINASLLTTATTIPELNITGNSNVSINSNYTITSINLTNSALNIPNSNSTITNIYMAASSIDSDEGGLNANLIEVQSGINTLASIQNKAFNATNITIKATLRSRVSSVTANYTLNLSAINLTIEAGGIINVTGAGHQGAASGANGTGPGGGDGCGGDITCSSAGAGYGGTGGAGVNGPTNNGGLSYGSVTEPTDIGSAGGGTGTTSRAGGNGGGAVFINVTGTLNITGQIIANGTNGNIDGGGSSADASGGGSGGSIYVRATTLTGTGSITANGGRGGDDNADGGGGAGGRIALYYTTSTHSGPIQATRSMAATSRSGGNGTIFKAWNLTGITQSLNVTSTGQSQSIRVNGTVLANNVTLNDTGFTEVVWANVSIMVGSTPQGNATSDPNLRYELNFTGPSTDGAYPVNATFVTQTGSVTLTVDTTAPTANISNNASTTTPANGVVNWTGNFTDNSALATYTFGFNDTESFANDTAVTISGTSRLVNVTKTITATRGKNVCGAFYVNDTAGNVNNSAYSCFDVANSPPTVTFTYPGNNALILSGNVSLQAGAGDNDGDAITFYWYINGSFNKTTTVNTTINFSRGNYAANVSANDGTTFSSNTTATFN